MNMKFTLASLGCGLMIALSGCTNLGTTTRGQSPEGGPYSQTGFHNKEYGTRVAEGVENHFHPNTTVTHHSATGYPSYPSDRAARRAERWGGGNGPQGNCPEGSCPHGNRIGQCPTCGNGVTKWAPRHYSSYSYERPNDLSWPAPNAPAGAMQYPYYTFKGPSDFFRDDDTRKSQVR